MKLKELLDYIWNELEIPVTKLELQNGVNNLCDNIRYEINKLEQEDEQKKQINHKRHPHTYSIYL